MSVAQKEIASALANAMRAIRTLSEVGSILHIDRCYVHRIEREALWKVYIRMMR